MEPIEDSEIERILVVTAHPDDVDFGAGEQLLNGLIKESR